MKAVYRGFYKVSGPRASQFEGLGLMVFGGSCVSGLRSCGLRPIVTCNLGNYITTNTILGFLLMIIVYCAPKPDSNY